MKLRKEILILLIVLISIGLSINLLFGVAKDIKDSFGIPAVVLLVVEDSTSLTTAENEIEDWLLGMRCTVVFADTEYMDESTYDGSVNWDTKDLAIIPLGTGNGTGMDTSKANGIGELPIICFEPTFWDSLGFPAQNSTHSNDSLLMPGTNTTFFDSIFTVDQGLKVVSAAQAHNKMKGGLLATNVVMLSIDKGDTICAYDTLNNQKRMAIGIETTTLLEVLPGEAYQGNGISKMLARYIALVTNNISDSLFNVVALGDTAAGTLYSLDANVWNYYSAHGHRIYFADSLSGKRGPRVTAEGKSVAWDDVDFVHVGSNVGLIYNTLDTVTTRNIPIISFAPNIGISSFGFGGSAGTYTNTDTLRIFNVASTITENFTLNDTFNLAGASIWASNIRTIASPSSGVTLGKLIRNGAVQTNTSWMVSSTARHVIFGLPSSVSDLMGINLISDGRDLIDTCLVWLHSSLPIQASGVTLTALNTDSMEISWTDNSSDEDGFSVYVHNPDSAYYSHLGAGVVKDTIFYIWPPNSKVTADVATIVGTDTVFSATGKVTAYADAAIPEAPRMWNKSDTEIYYSTGGYEFEDIFSDSNYTSNPTWVSIAGTWDVDNPDNWLEAVAVNDTMSIAYDHNVDLFRDAYISFDVRLADSTYLSLQTARFYINSNTSDFTGTGYFVEIDSTALTFEKFTGASETVLITYVWERDFDWHTILLQYNWAESPQDTSVMWTMSYDGTSTGTSTDETYLPTTGTHIGMTASHAGIHFDDFWIYGVTPGANHSRTPYALNESNSGDYVNFNTGLLASGETWGLYSDFGSFAGGTLTGLTKATSYVFRMKAKSGVK